jgi:6-pyruvoyltetrahydropterin/6-carboxytetrahydropterin synthase
MFEVTVESGFSAAHRLRDYEGACERLHGHNYRVAVTVRGEAVGISGMLVDFKGVRGTLGRVLDKLDHICLNEDVEDFGEGGLNPTAENIAKWIFDRLAETSATELPDGAALARVTVWESEKSSATYVPE